MHSTHTTKITSSNYSARPQNVQVYTPGFRNVLSIPQHAIRHMPPANLNVTRLVLCANFDASMPDTSCPMGNRCKFVHADTSAAKEHSIHVNYAWRSLDEVTYERFPAGQVLHVAPPNSKTASDVMDSDLALKTKALTSTRRPLSHCAHYYFNRTCNLGSECQFVHAVFIDPTAKDHQRAPVPSQLGEGRELQLSKKQREQRMREGLPVSPVSSVAPTPRGYIAHPTTAPAVPRLPTTTVAAAGASSCVCHCTCNCGCCDYVESTVSRAAAAGAIHAFPVVRNASTAFSAAGATPENGSDLSDSPRDGGDFATPALGDSCSSLGSSQHVTPRLSAAASPSSLSGSLSAGRRYRHNPYNSGARVILVE